MLRTGLFSLLIITLIITTSCSDDAGSGTLEADQTDLLANLGDNVILPAYQNLVSNAQDLKSKVTTFQSSVNSDNLEAVKASLKGTRLAWQDCMMYDFGPASSNGLASNLNIFPVSVTSIESNISSANFSLTAAAASDQRGFQAMSYLVYGGETDVDVLSLFEQDENRLTYLATLADLIEQKSVSVLADWENEYLATFKDGSGTDVGSSLGQLVNAMTQSFERKTRDAKLGIPVGIRSLGIPNPDRIEALYAGYSIELANQNMQAYNLLFTGGDGDGLADYLDQIDAKTLDNQSLAQDILQQLQKCITAVAAIDEPLSAEVVDNPSETELAVAEIQTLLVKVKTEMVSALGITITYQDNDGD